MSKRKKARCTRCGARIWFLPASPPADMDLVPRLCKKCQGGDGEAC